MFAVLASSCKDMLNPEEIEKANPGDEVVFGAALPGNTKTVYGDETSTGFPIYWVNGDKVRVASPQCLSGRNSAEYQIAAGANQNYATSMTKTGDVGVQWGDADKADFYSIYPSSASTKLEVSGEGVTTTLHVDATQFASTTDNGTSYYAQPAEMGNVVMYAKTAGVTSGSTVELHYTPFSTVLEFEINAPSEPVAGKQTEITIQSLTLTAPTGTTIAGDFGFTFPTGESTTPSIEAATGGSNAITMHFLDNNQYTTELSTTKTTLKAKMCLMPISGNLAGWKIEVNTSAGTFSKTLGANDSKGTATTLDPGKVHKIKLPALNYGSKEWVYSLDRWIPTLPDYTNIYLSEISLPGAWYAGATEGVSNGTGYQATSSITDLWKAGVRAFAVECRTNSTYTNWHWTPNYVCISGTGSNTAGGGAYRSGTNITTVLDGIRTALASHQDEYAVLVLSYADGGEGAHRAEDHAYFLQGVATALSSYTDIVYSGPITKNTTIGDVKGKLIVKVNIDADITIGTYTAANALISYNPFPLQITANTDTDLNGLSVPYFSNLSWSTWGDDTDTHRSYFRAATVQQMSDPFVWCFSSANRTDCTNITSEDGTVSNTQVATLSQRKAALKAMSVYSKQIYDNSTHNVWFYYNCGGTHATVKEGGSPSPITFASKMNEWLLNRIKMKCGEVANDNGEFKPEPSPLGIVMFNQCTGDNTTYFGADIIKYIIEMNSKFYLKHAGTSGGSTGGDATPTAENDVTVSNAGPAI